MIGSEAYQAFASLADHAGLFEHPEVIRALDWLAYEGAATGHLLPWPRENGLEKPHDCRTASGDSMMAEHRAPTIRKALEPVAAMATPYEDPEGQHTYPDEHVVTHVDFAGYRLTVGDLRRAREALSALDSLGEVGELVDTVAMDSERIKELEAELMRADNLLATLKGGKQEGNHD